MVAAAPLPPAPLPPAPPVVLAVVGPASVPAVPAPPAPLVVLALVVTLTDPPVVLLLLAPLLFAAPVVAAPVVTAPVVLLLPAACPLAVLLAPPVVAAAVAPVLVTVVVPWVTPTVAPSLVSPDVESSDEELQAATATKDTSGRTEATPSLMLWVVRVMFVGISASFEAAACKKGRALVRCLRPCARQTTVYCSCPIPEVLI